MVRRKSAGVRRKNSAGLEQAFVQEIATVASIEQSITAVGDQITLPDTDAAIIARLVNTDANRTLTSNPCIQPGTRIGQLLILRGAGAFTLTIPDGNGTALAGNASKALGAADYMILWWSGSNWEQVTAVNAN